MQKQELVTKINEVFEEYFELERELLEPDAHIFEDLGLDSLDIVDLIVAMQKKFGVNIRDDERLKQIRTLNDLYEFTDSIKDQFTVQDKP
ncbi:MAG: acyl carrier protein [Thermodesulfobacteriota bacterium]